MKYFVATVAQQEASATAIIQVSASMKSQASSTMNYHQRKKKTTELTIANMAERQWNRVVTKTLHQYVKDVHADDEDRTKNLHVTDVTGRCPVGVVLEKARVITREPTPPGKSLRFEVGHIIEEFVREGLEHAGVACKNQKMRFTWPKLNMVGTPDIGIVEEGQEILIEVKSIHTNAFSQMNGIPHEHYVEQLQMYLEKYRKRKGKKDTYGILFYMALDGCTDEYLVEYDPKVVKKIKARAAVLHECIQTKKRPTMEDYFVIKETKKGPQWKLNWKTSYCYMDGIHQHCDKALWDKLEPESTKQMIGKLEYQAKKATEKGTNPNDWIKAVKGEKVEKPKPEVEEIDGLTYVKDAQ